MVDCPVRTPSRAARDAMQEALRGYDDACRRAEQTAAVIAMCSSSPDPGLALHLARLEDEAERSLKELLAHVRVHIASISVPAGQVMSERVS